MKIRLIKLKPLLWLAMGLILGNIISTGVSYFVVQVIPINQEVATVMFNQALQAQGMKDKTVTELIVSTELNCNPVQRNRIEKHCEQDIALVFSNGTVVYGSCDTWSYKSFICMTFKQNPVKIVPNFGDLA